LFSSASPTPFLSLVDFFLISLPPSRIKARGFQSYQINSCHFNYLRKAIKNLLSTFNSSLFVAAKKGLRNFPTFLFSYLITWKILLLPVKTRKILLDGITLLLRCYIFDNEISLNGITFSQTSEETSQYPPKCNNFVPYLTL
jgi:hypothetical protein